MHYGIDIAMPKGAPVGATMGGKVVYAGFGQKGSGYGGYGNVVVVKDSAGRLHQYSHLDSIGVKVGQTVGNGAVIGKAGSTGRSTGPHLDYIVKNSKGNYLNPTSFITGKNTLKTSQGIQRAEGTKAPTAYANNWKTKEAPKSSSFKSYLGHLNTAVSSGLVPRQWAIPLTELVGRESSWNPSAKNPKSTARGYGQFLNQTVSQYAKKTGLNYNNPVHQLAMMAQYVKDRYGSPEKALQFWDKNKWY
ncbi:aggregation-promoting factor C-terminal-like domain-containing protein [Cytobacillus oceanisediminis]|uniref:aggregation-promoting factor C-terminal-like domain-containing protein n=1 Tax=Cytobacillus oceanisediminis TaxID=665099 RepID=UPI001C22528F|nr:peptidoglycan DD-metalloendopeptidase family protein [Cytobacillus oceanisediminis]MBU8770340.1 M23 family metallopeptidase [Cytobacillus oceanisediminis]